MARQNVTAAWELLNTAAKASEQLHNYPVYVVGALAVLGLSFILPDSSRGKVLSGAPVVGRRWFFEPAWFTKLRFTVQGWEISHEGWLKVGFQFMRRYWATR